jgi:hypothetical protein
MHEFNDVNLPYEHVSCTDEELIDTIVKFFKTKSELIYPAKSYFVAIVYAYYLQKYFSVEFDAALDDADLLPDDICFTPYSQSKHVYNEVLARIESIEYYESIQKTLQYFKQEFLIGDE